MENRQETLPEEQAFYFDKPSLMLRIKSMVIDGAVMLTLFFLASFVLNILKVESETVRGATLVAIFLYEPLLVWLGCTIGQALMGIRVRHYGRFLEGEKVRVGLPASLLRYATKALLGWLSLLIIHSDTYGQAIHDKVGNSVMLSA